jgi:hypothetical protein
VIVAVPDHGHALRTVMGLPGGNDVYGERRMSLTVSEKGRL